MTTEVMTRSSSLFGLDEAADATKSPFTHHHGGGEGLGEEPYQTARNLYEEGKQLHENGNYEAAIGAFREAMSIQEPLLGKYHWYTIKTYWRMGRSHWGLSEKATDRTQPEREEHQKAAVRCWKRSLRLAEKLAGSDNPATKNLLEDINTCLKSSGTKLSTSSSTKTMSYMDIIKKALDYERKGDDLMKQKKSEKALKKYKKVLKLEQSVCSKELPSDMDSTSNHSTTKTSIASTSSNCTLDGADVACKIGSLYRMQGDIKASVAAYEMAQSAYHDSLGEDHPASYGAAASLRALREAGTTATASTRQRRRWWNMFSRQ